MRRTATDDKFLFNEKGSFFTVLKMLSVPPDNPAIKAAKDTRIMLSDLKPSPGDEKKKEAVK
jgi:hypothetical protein